MGYGLLNLLFVYMVFSLMLAVFNLVYLRQLKRERRHRENARRLLQAGRTRLRKALTEKGTRAERRRIRRFSMARYLGRFEEELKEVAAYDPALVRAYFQKYEAEYMMLIVPIQKMGVTEKTMYARLVMKYGINADQKSAAFAAAMIRLMDRSSMFLMYNVLGALAVMGMPEALSDALKVMTEQGFYCYSKVITNALMWYAGSRNELLLLLLKNQNEYNPEIRCALLEYARKEKGPYKRDILRILENGSENLEVRLEALRYFIKYPSIEAEEVVRKLLLERKTMDWRYAALGVKVLAAFPSAENRALVRTLTYDPIWYVHQNATEAWKQMERGHA